MRQNIKATITRYVICFLVASLMVLTVFAIKGFFTDSVAVNIQILSDGFCIAGLMFLAFAGMMYISGEGALLGIGYAMKSVLNMFVPMNRKNHERYADYRERKLGSKERTNDPCFLVTGLVFFLTGITFTIIWYTKFYNVG